MTTAQGAEYLGLSPRHMRELIARGDLPAERQETARGLVWWIQRADLDAFRVKREEASRTNEPRKRGRPPKVPKPPNEGRTQ